MKRYTWRNIWPAKRTETNSHEHEQNAATMKNIVSAGNFMVMETVVKDINELGENQDVDCTSEVLWHIEVEQKQDQIE